MTAKPPPRRGYRTPLSVQIGKVVVAVFLVLILVGILASPAEWVRRVWAGLMFTLSAFVFFSFFVALYRNRKRRRAGQPAPTPTPPASGAGPTDAAKQ